MSALLDAATAELAYHKRIYVNGLRQVNRKLRAAVVANPAELSAAAAVVKSYVTDWPGEPLRRVMPAFFDDQTALELVQISDSVTVTRV